ncbi:MAG: MATE family efflux transporter [Clostridia bacterium]
MNKNTEKLGTQSILKLLVRMSLPAMFSMLIQALYNLVDSIFVAKYSQTALLAITYAFPLQMLVNACAIGIGVGTNSLVSRKLGENKFDEASKSAQNGLFIALIIATFFTVLAYPLSRLYIGFYVDDPIVFNDSINYLSICISFCFVFFTEITCSKIIQATGNMLYPMLSQLVGAITNIILDPILIFGLLGTKPLGIIGAAIATVIGQMLALICTLIIVKKIKLPVKIFNAKFRPEKKYASAILKVSVPSTLMLSISSITTSIMNVLLKAYKECAVTVLGIYFRLEQFVFMPIFGLNQGAMPILGYNYGAKQKKRFVKTFCYSLIISFVLICFGLTIFNTIPHLLLKMFNAEGETLELGIIALKRISLCFIPASFGIIISAMFQAVGHGIKSFMMSFLRQLVLIVPFAYIFGKFWGLNAIWFCYPVAELICIAIFIPVAIFTINKIFKKPTQALNFAQLDNN